MWGLRAARHQSCPGSLFLPDGGRLFLMDNGLSIRDIAGETSISKSTVQRIKRAIERGNVDAE
jgi:hypothetical protein